MKRVLLMTAAVLALATMPARADLIFLGQSDLTGIGFGDAHRLMTMHQPSAGGGTIETGFMTPIDVPNGDAIANTSGLTDKSNTPTTGALGWVSGANVGLAFDVSQTGGTGLTLQTMGFTLFGSNNQPISCVGCTSTFQLPSPFQITPAQASAATGNGRGLLFFGLNSTEQAEFNFDLLHAGTMTVGAFGSWGCSGTPSATCMPANDGQDTLLGFQAVPSPIIGAGLPGLITGLLGLVGLSRFRSNRRVA